MKKLLVLFVLFVPHAEVFASNERQAQELAVRAIIAVAAVANKVENRRLSDADSAIANTVTCSPNEVAFGNGCMACDSHQIPNPDRTRCVPSEAVLRKFADTCRSIGGRTPNSSTCILRRDAECKFDDLNPVVRKVYDSGRNETRCHL